MYSISSFCKAPAIFAVSLFCLLPFAVEAINLEQRPTQVPNLVFTDHRLTPISLGDCSTFNFDSVPPDSTEAVQIFVVEVDVSGTIIVELLEVPASLNLELTILGWDQTGRTVLLTGDPAAPGTAGAPRSAAAYVTPGQYYIQVSNVIGSTNERESYSLCTDFIDNDREGNQTINLATPIRLGQCYEDRILGENRQLAEGPDPGADEDWFYIDVDVPGTITVELPEVPASLNLELVIFGRDQFGGATILTGDRAVPGITGAPRSVAAYVTPGQYYVWVNNATGSADEREPYYLCTNFIVNDREGNQTIDLATPVRFGECYEDRIIGENRQLAEGPGPGADEDWFYVDVDVPGTITVELPEVPSSLNLELIILGRDQRGRAVILTGDPAVPGKAGTPRSAAAYVTPGQYYIWVSNATGSANEMEPYYLCTDFIINDREGNQTIDLASSVQLGECYEDRILGENRQLAEGGASAADEDWFYVDVDVPGTITVELPKVPAPLNLELSIVGRDQRGRAILLTSDPAVPGTVGAPRLVSILVDPGQYYIWINNATGSATEIRPYYFCVDFEAADDLNGFTVSNRDGEQLESTIKIFPNPANHYLEVLGFDDPFQYSITDAAGSVVAQHESATGRIDISRLQRGVYVVHVYNSTWGTARKIIKQ